MPQQVLMKTTSQDMMTLRNHHGWGRWTGTAELGLLGRALQVLQPTHECWSWLNTLRWILRSNQWQSSIRRLENHHNPKGDDETKEVSWTIGKTPIRWITPGTRNGAIQALIATTFQNMETSRDDPTLDLLVELAGSKVWQENVNECVILTL